MTEARDPSSERGLTNGRRGLLATIWRHRSRLLAILDVLTIGGIFMAAYYLRFHVEFLAIKRVPVADAELYLKGGWFLAGVWTFFIWRDGGYADDLHGVRGPVARYRSLLLAGVYAMGALMSLSFLFRDFLLSRQVYLMTGGSALAALVLWRLLFSGLDRLLAARGVTAQRVVIVGRGHTADAVSDQLAHHNPTMRVIGVVQWSGTDTGDTGDAGDTGGKRRTAEYPVLGPLAELKAIYQRTPFDTLVLSPGEGSSTLDGSPQIVETLNFCESHGVSVYMSPGSFNVAVTLREVGTFGDTPLIRIQDASLHPVYALAKRTIDLLVATVALLLTLPVCLVVAILIKTTSKGPVIFSQIRAGLHGRPFKMYKFRSMVAGADKKLGEVVDIDALAEPVFKVENDPRVTPFGRFLRRSSIDELPQLLNVLNGQMSLVGPRPEELQLVERYDPWQRRRLKAKPGITGYQQVVNRGANSLEERVKYDLVYLKHQSLLFDLYILLRTIFVVARGTGTTR